MAHQNIHKKTKYIFGCHCIETTQKCKKILWFLTMMGRFTIKENVQILYRATITSTTWRFTKSFTDLIDGILYPKFHEIFSKKDDYLKSINNGSRYHEARDIDTAEKCQADGEYCIAALVTLGDLLNKFFRRFSVLNKDYESANGTLAIEDKRYYGTLLANVNFQLYDDQSTYSQQGVTTFQLQQELKNLANSLITPQK